MIIREIQINAAHAKLTGELILPHEANSIVIFSHGSGSSRFSPRNRAVGKSLNERGLGTLLFDLLTEEEDKVYENRFDIDLLTQRLISTFQFMYQQPELENFSFGFFGSSTGSASALMAAAELGTSVKAIVSRGGRPDLAMNFLPQVEAATLLIVGGLDGPVIKMNQDAFENLECEKELVILPGATHLFEEPGKLEEVSELAADWYLRYL